ncbi:hypothetical protein [Luteimonas vadosa]|uniref:HEAT repeat domain-containing protein n=1 Tax=Luteimonas vadosa TaxID=1165507 RepID=A0ABP9DXC5_9GAMM
MRKSLQACCLALGIVAASIAHAQQYELDLSRIDLSAIDPQAAAAIGGDVLRRAPDPAIDDLFQAVHASSRTPREAALLCGLFEPDADRSMAALQRTVERMGPDSRERFANAFVGVALAGLQGEPAAYDAAQARQALKATVVKAGFLHAGFSAGINASGDDAASREARCTAFGQLVDVLGNEPLETRALATRWLLEQGLTLAVAAR